MIQIKKVVRLPDLNRLSYFARGDASKFASNANSRLWEVMEEEKFLGVFGITFGALIGTGPVVWFAAGKDLHEISFHGLRFLYRTLQRLPMPRMTAYVQGDFRAANHFARFLGFKAICQTNNVKVFERWV